MTYLAQYWKVFSAGTKIYLATKRLNRAINRRLVNIGLRDEFLQLAAELVERIDNEQTRLQQEYGTSFDALRNQYFELEEYKVTTKAQLASFKVCALQCLSFTLRFIHSFIPACLGLRSPSIALLQSRFPFLHAAAC